MTESYHELIREKNSALVVLKQQMEIDKQQFLHVSTIFIARWFIEQTKYQIKRDAQRTLDFEDIKLKELKDEVEALSKDASKIALKFLSDSELWWHVEESGNHNYDYAGNRPPNLIDKPIRLALGTLAPLLEEYGYLKPQVPVRGDFDCWREWDKNGNQKLQNGRPFYPLKVEWSGEMKNAIASYSQKMKNGIRIRLSIMELEAEKKKQEASKRWDAL